MGLRPRNDVFIDLFTAAAENVATAAEVLGQLVIAAPADRAALGRQLKELEHRGDAVTHDIMRTLNTSFITPFDRQDIAVLAGSLDDVIDAIEGAGDLCILYRLQALPAGVARQATLLSEAAEVTVEAMPRLRKLSKLDAYWISINEIENRADAVYRSLLAELFDAPTDVLATIKTKEVVDQLEAAADAFERVANVVQSIAAKEA